MVAILICELSQYEYARRPTRHGETYRFTDAHRQERDCLEGEASDLEQTALPGCCDARTTSRNWLALPDRFLPLTGKTNLSDQLLSQTFPCSHESSPCGTR